MASGSKIQGSVIGSKIGGYEVEALIGRGAMGSVYLARDTKLNRHVALKVLLGSLARTPSIVKQFRQEAQAAAPLHHPNIVRIYSAGQDAATPYIAMEFVDGEPLDRFLVRKGKLSWDVALHIGAQVASALDCAHKHGVIHRDIKPSNILVDKRGSVRLTDFGIARMQSDDDAGVVGTPQYMSPEQVSGKKVGPVSDLFALGVTLYQMISGEMPFRGESSMALVKSVCEDTPPRLNRLISSVPDDVARLVAYLIEKEPSGRPASAKVAYGLIHRLLKQRGVATTVADSITAFLQEEMEARPFSSLEKEKARAERKSRKVRRQTSTSGKLVRLAPHAVLIFALAIGAFMLGPLAVRRARAALPDPAREMGLADASAIAPGVTRVTMFADGFEIRGLAWAGDEFLAVHLQGERGRLTDGSEGIAAIDVASGRVLSLVPPFRRGEADGSTPGTVVGVGMPLAGIPASSAFHRAFPVLATGDRAGSVVLLAQDVDAAAPRPHILFETNVTEMSTAGTGSPETGSSLTMNPNGTRVCIVMRSADEGGAYLFEQELDPPPSRPGGVKKTSGYMELVPGTVRYTPDGRRIGYLAIGNDRRQELRLVSSSDSQMDGQLIVSGVAGSDYAFSPDSARVALALESVDGKARVAVVDLALREVIQQFGQGTVSRDAWLPGGDTFVYSGFRNEADARAALLPQLIRATVSATAPSAAPVVTLPGGVASPYAVAPDGRRIAAEVRGGRSAGVYLIEMDRPEGR